MKKMIVFSAIAGLAGFAMAAPECGADCAWGYKVKTILKTTTAANISNATTCVAGCYRKPATKRYLGYFFGKTEAGQGTCGASSCGCNDYTAGNLVVWNFDTKQAVKIDSASFIQLNRIGYADTKTAEIAFTVNDLTFAGFGTCGKRADGTVAIKNANGFVAGLIPGLCSTCDEVCGAIDPSTCVDTDANVWSICGDPGTSKTTAAYGKWAMAWDAEIVDRITTGKTVLDDDGKASAGFIPAGFAQVEADAVVTPEVATDFELAD